LISFIKKKAKKKNSGKTKGLEESSIRMPVNNDYDQYEDQDA